MQEQNSDGSVVCCVKVLSMEKPKVELTIYYLIVVS
jgi:hypothetical protein